MAIEPVPTPDTLPTVPNRETQQGNELSNNMDAFSFAIGPWGESIKDVGDNVYNNALETKGFAEDAESSESNAAASEASAASDASAAQTAYSQTLAVKAIVDETEGTITSGDTFSETTAWNNIRTAWETGSHGKPIILDLDFARDSYSEYGGLSAGYTRAPLLDIVSFSRASIATGKNAFGNIETVGVNEPRIVFDKNGAALLIEKDGENRLTWSEDFSDSIWVTIGSVTNLGTKSVVGGDEFLFQAGNNGYIRQVLSVSADNEYYTSYFIFSNPTSNIISIRTALTGGTAVFSTESANISDMSVTDPSSTKIEKVGEYYILSHTIQNNGTNTTIDCRYFATDAGAINASDTVTLAAAQLEQSSTPSSYTKTEALPQVRAADYCEVEIPDGFNESGDWSLFSEFTPLEASLSTHRYISISSGNNVNRVTLRHLDGFYQIIFTASSSTSFLGLPAACDVGVKAKVMIVKSGLNFRVFINGSEATTHSIGNEFSSLSDIFLGNSSDGSTPTGTLLNKTTLIAEAVSDEEARVYTSI